jgi:hypothetical protein
VDGYEEIDCVDLVIMENSNPINVWVIREALKAFAAFNGFKMLVVNQHPAAQTTAIRAPFPEVIACLSR